MNFYCEQLYRHMQNLRKGEYIKIRDELCEYLRWSRAKYYHKVMGETRLSYQERVLIESYFGIKIFKNE